MLQGEHSAILSTFIKLPFVFNTFVLSTFKWPLKTGFTVITKRKRGSSVVRHLPLVLEVPGSIPARGEKNFGVQTRFL